MKVIAGMEKQLVMVKLPAKTRMKEASGRAYPLAKENIPGRMAAIMMENGSKV